MHAIEIHFEPQLFDFGVDVTHDDDSDELM